LEPIRHEDGGSDLSFENQALCLLFVNKASIGYVKCVDDLKTLYELHARRRLVSVNNGKRYVLDVAAKSGTN
jgi:hypothetical protein